MQPSPLSKTATADSDSEDELDSLRPKVDDVADKLAKLEVKDVDVDIDELHPLHPAVISKQATINIGMYIKPSRGYAGAAPAL